MIHIYIFFNQSLLERDVAVALKKIHPRRQKKNWKIYLFCNGNAVYANAMYCTFDWKCKIISVIPGKHLCLSIISRLAISSTSANAICV